jgi:hypothetical protein
VTKLASSSALTEKLPRNTVLLGAKFLSVLVRKKIPKDWIRFSALTRLLIHYFCIAYAFPYVVAVLSKGVEVRLSFKTQSLVQSIPVLGATYISVANGNLAIKLSILITKYGNFQ